MIIMSALINECTKLEELLASRGVNVSGLGPTCSRKEPAVPSDSASAAPAPSHASVRRKSPSSEASSDVEIPVITSSKLASFKRYLETNCHNEACKQDCLDRYEALGENNARALEQKADVSKLEDHPDHMVS